jgi:dGTPase
MVADIVAQSSERSAISMSEEVERATNRLKDFLYERVYRVAAVATGENERVRRIVTQLFRFYMENPSDVPGGEEAAAGSGKALARRVCDYLAGMTDRFAAQQFELHFVPRRWRGAD